MEQPSGAGFELWHAVTTVLAGGVLWAWRYVTGNIKELKDNSVTKAEFKEYVDGADVRRTELRNGVIKLFDGQRDLSKDINDGQKAMTETINLHYTELLKAIHEAKK